MKLNRSSVASLGSLNYAAHCALAPGAVATIDTHAFCVAPACSTAFLLSFLDQWFRAYRCTWMTVKVTGRPNSLWSKECELGVNHLHSIRVVKRISPNMRFATKIDGEVAFNLLFNNCKIKRPDYQPTVHNVYRIRTIHGNLLIYFVSSVHRIWILDNFVVLFTTSMGWKYM